MTNSLMYKITYAVNCTLTKNSKEKEEEGEEEERINYPAKLTARNVTQQ